MNSGNQQDQEYWQPGQPGQPGQMQSQGNPSNQDSRFGTAQAGQQNAVQAQAQDQGQGLGLGLGQGSRDVSSAAPLGRPARSSRRASVLLPPVDIFEDESGLILIADMPGVAKKQLVVRVTGDNLLIEGAATIPVTGSMELVYGEIQSPQYQRRFTLSRELAPGKIEAKRTNGVLSLRIPKAEHARPRRIEFSVS